jgi:hypothetical protein
MKKYILYTVVILAVAAVAAWNVNLNSEGNKLSELSLANVEALALDNINVLLFKARV